LPPSPILKERDSLFDQLKEEVMKNETLEKQIAALIATVKAMEQEVQRLMKEVQMFNQPHKQTPTSPNVSKPTSQRSEIDALFSSELFNSETDSTEPNQKANVSQTNNENSGGWWNMFSFSSPKKQVN